MALETDIPNELPYNDYFEYFGPDFKLHIAPSNMSNQNTSEYMDKIRSRLLENLRMLPHAPGVQMADIPEDSLDINKEKEAEVKKEEEVKPNNTVDELRPNAICKQCQVYIYNFYRAKSNQLIMTYTQV